MELKKRFKDYSREDQKKIARIFLRYFQKPGSDLAVPRGAIEAAIDQYPDMIFDIIVKNSIMGIEHSEPIEEAILYGDLYELLNKLPADGDFEKDEQPYINAESRVILRIINLCEDK